jgi:hypothetical protein
MYGYINASPFAFNLVLHGGKWLISRPCAVTLGKNPVPIKYDAGWVLEPVKERKVKVNVV